METALRRQVLGLAARAVEVHLNADHSDAAPAPACGCGATARFAGRRSKRFKTVLGEIRLRRAYFHCADCGEGFCPRDRELGMTEGSLSPALARMVAVTGSTTSFRESSDLLRELAGVEVGSKQVERRAESIGREIACYEREVSEPDSEAPIPATIYLGMDGTGRCFFRQVLLSRGPSARLETERLAIQPKALCDDHHQGK